MWRFLFSDIRVPSFVHTWYYYIIACINRIKIILLSGKLNECHADYILEVHDLKVRTQMMYDMEALLRKVFKQIRNEVNEILDKELSRNEFTILRILSEQGPKK